MFNSTEEIYIITYKFLCIVKSNSFNDAMDSVLNPLARNDCDDVVDVCVNNNLITGIDLHKNDYGNYLTNIRHAARITPQGIRFIELYNKYSSEGIDPLVLLHDSSSLIMFFKDKYDKVQRRKFWIAGFTFLSGVIATKLVDLYLKDCIEWLLKLWK